MYSVLLVEDEKIELDTLRDYINWDKVSVDRVFTARNGRSAFECIVQNEPDIMITDIQMPIMTGIELAKKVREEGYKTKIVFLTGYDDFDYVKEAFRVQAADYILKPFMTEEVEKLIAKIEKQIDSERTAEVSRDVAAKHMLEQLCRGDLAEEADRLGARYFNRPGNMVTYGMLAVYGMEEGELLQGTGENLAEVYHSFRMGDSLIVILQNHLYFRDSAKRIGNVLDGRFTIACFKEKIPLSGLRSRAELLLKLADKAFFGKRGEILDAGMEEADGRGKEEERRYPPEKKENLYRAIQSGDWDKAGKELEIILKGFNQFKREECIREAYGLYFELKGSLMKGDFQAISRAEEEGDLEEKIRKGKYWEDIEKALASYCRSITSFFAKQHEDPNYHIIVRIRDYLELHYSGVCSVEEMAEEVHLSPNYLRSLFKESMGQTILEYVTDYRLLKACELLRDKTLRVKEIGRLVGYDNESYFGTVFAKKYGVTPNEYRKMV